MATLDDELMEGLPDILLNPETEEDRLQAIRIAALRAVYREGGTAPISKILGDTNIKLAKGGNVSAQQLIPILEVFPDNFMVSEEEADKTIALLAIDVDDVSMLEEAATKGLLAKVKKGGGGGKASKQFEGGKGGGANGHGYEGGKGGGGSVQDKIHEAVTNALWPAVARVAHMEANLSQSQMVARIAKHVYKAASSPELQAKPWQEACKDLVSQTMHGYTASCGECEWFIYVDLVPAFCAAAQLAFRGAKWKAMQEVVTIEFEDSMDRKMLEKGMWEATQDTFSTLDEKAQKKIYSAVSRSYWPTFDEVLASLHPSDELRNIEEFARKWMKNAVGRAWGGVEQPEEVFNEEALTEFFLRMVAPFGPDDPYSCFPGALVETIGMPPADWPFIQEVVCEVLNKGTGGSSMESSKKRRKIEEPSSKAVGKARPTSQKAVFRPGAGLQYETSNGRASAGGKASTGGKSSGGGRGSAANATTCQAGTGHPECTSAEDCIGAPTSRLVQHMVTRNQGGDIYCEPCWCTFVRRNPQLNGIFLD